MRASWTALYQQLITHCNRRSSEIAYGNIRTRQPLFESCGSIADLLHHQNAPGGDSARRNAVLKALIVEAQLGQNTAKLASIIVILALWPGLDAVHGRMCRDFPETRDNHGTDILAHVSIASRTLDLKAVNRIAATLVMNAERDIRRAHIAQRNRYKTELSIESPMGADALAVSAPDEQRYPVDAWRNRLTKVLGRDADLFLRIIILGETQLEAGTALGLSPAAARKRHQRGMVKLQAAANNLSALSHSAAGIGFYPSEARDAGPREVT